MNPAHVPDDLKAEDRGSTWNAPTGLSSSSAFSYNYKVSVSCNATLGLDSTAAVVTSAYGIAVLESIDSEASPSSMP